MNEETDNQSYTAVAVLSKDPETLQNFAFSYVTVEDAGPMAICDTRYLPSDVTVQELGALLSMSIRLPAQWVNKHFGSVSRLFRPE